MADAELGLVEAVPVCCLCGQPSPRGDPCETCIEVERILAMSDEQVLAESTPEELGWAKGFKEGLRLSLAVRRVALEEAAKIAETWGNRFDANSMNDEAAGAWKAAAAIRALKPSPPPSSPLKMGGDDGQAGGR